MEGVPDNWIPEISEADASHIHNVIANASNDQQILTKVQRYSVRMRSLRRLYQGLELDNTVVNAYCTMLQDKCMTRRVKIMGTSFFSRLYNPDGINKYQPSDTLNLKQVASYTRTLDIFQYQLILIPVLLKHHWTLIAVDTTAEQIRYYDSGPGDGLQYITAVKRWLAYEWNGNTATNSTQFPSDQWRLCPSTAAITPQQEDNLNCGIFMLMFVELLATGRDVGCFNAEFRLRARRYIAMSLLRGYTDKVTTTPLKGSGCSPIRALRRSNDQPTGLNMNSIIDDEFYEEGTQEAADGIDPLNATSETNKDKYMDLQSVADPSGWLTDGVLNSYFAGLTERSRQRDSNQLFLPTHFFHKRAWLLSG